MSLFPAKVEYIVVDVCCAQMLWVKQHLFEFRVDIGCVDIFCNNMSTISISNNPVHHSKTKRIDIRHHFLRVHDEKRNIRLTFCHIESQLADIFTNPLARELFERNRMDLGMIHL